MTDKQLSDMGVSTVAGGGGLEFKPLAEGSYDFIIHGIIGLGLRPHTYQGEERPPVSVIKVIFELPEEIRDDKQTQVIGYKLNMSVHEKSNHYAFCRKYLGDRVTKDTMAEFVSAAGLKQLLGAVGVLTVRHWVKDDRVIATIDREGFSKLDARLPKPIATRPAFFFNPFNPDIEVFKNNLTDYARKEVMEALNAENFPAELHQAYAKCLEDKAAAEASKAASTAKAEVPVTVADGAAAAIE